MISNLIQAIGGPIDGTWFTHPDIVLHQDDPQAKEILVDTVLIDQEPKPTHCHQSTYRLANPRWGVWEYHFVVGSTVVVPCPDMDGAVQLPQ